MMTALPKSAQAPWALYEAWCAARGYEDARVYIPERLEAFWGDVPAAEKTRREREKGIRLAFETFGAVASRTGHHRSAWRQDARLAGLGDTLASIPTAGYPHGFRGRRDAYMLVLLHQGFRREDAQEIGWKDIRWPAPGRILIRGELIPTDPAPERCPACAVGRWLRAVSLAHYRSRVELMSTLNRQLSWRVDGHVCEQGDDSWRETYWSLMPPIDAAGSNDLYIPLTKAAITQIATVRRALARTSLPVVRQDDAARTIALDLDVDASLERAVVVDTETATARRAREEDEDSAVSDALEATRAILRELGITPT